MNQQMSFKHGNTRMDVSEVINGEIEISFSSHPNNNNPIPFDNEYLRELIEWLQIQLGEMKSVPKKKK